MEIRIPLFQLFLTDFSESAYSAVDVDPGKQERDPMVTRLTEARLQQR
jgi:hypothetical protein